MDAMIAGSPVSLETEPPNLRHEVRRLFAEFHPQDTIEVGVDNVGVMRQLFRQRGLSIAASTTQRRRDPHRIAACIEQLGL